MKGKNQKMVDLSNYYQRDPGIGDTTPSERFPNNHVSFSPLLMPLHWLDRVHRIFGSMAFKSKHAMLKEYDSAAPLDACLGTEAELKQVRKLIVSFAEGFDNNSRISVFGRFFLRRIVLDLLKNRKRVLRFYHSNKEFIETNGKFKAPVIITGLPRSGTTLLQRLISEDPNTRSPYSFEMNIAIPPMASQADPLKDPRRKKSSGRASIFSWLAPGLLEKFRESHVWLPTEKEESFISMLAHNGISQMNNSTAGKKYINDFYQIEDKRLVFRYERLFFTMLDAYRPVRSHWTLKAPNYAPCFPILFEEYPDARVVLAHRNPIVTLPSICRLMESWCIAFDQDGSFDKHRFGQFQKPFIENSLMVPFNYRKTHLEKEDQIFDCMYEELSSDPIAMVKRIYQYFDLDYTLPFEKRMMAYLKNDSQKKHGRHKYSLEEYGFDADSLYEEYKDYMEHFNFKIPGKASVIPMCNTLKFVEIIKKSVYHEVPYARKKLTS
ncbi:MAG: sulfotransferase [Desulfatitalea sp.]|nr:sulfotransferase [Desulfatitalea sp.]NNK00892.1 sulfotransferase [Desulfatitalea sp.]